MIAKISNTVVRDIIEHGKPVDTNERVAELEKKLAKVRKDIAEEERLEKRWQLLETACGKLRKEMGKTLTNEEYNAIDGIYIFVHSGCVDFLRHIPSATDTGENKRLNQDLDTVEALHELDYLTKEAK
ncbi:hypothetical protein ES703_20837 [subsurface metagenome]